MGAAENSPLPDLSALTEGGRLRAPRDLLARLNFLAALLRDVAPAAGGSSRLLWRDEFGRAHSLAVDRVLRLGREETCDFVVNSARASRHHCEITPLGAAASLRDLGSTNGTRVNGVELDSDPRVLVDGDILDVGGMWIAYVADEWEGAQE